MPCRIGWRHLGGIGIEHLCTFGIRKLEWKKGFSNLFSLDYLLTCLWHQSVCFPRPTKDQLGSNSGKGCGEMMEGMSNLEISVLSLIYLATIRRILLTLLMLSEKAVHHINASSELLLLSAARCGWIGS
jgi:hypothetical protein